MSIRSAIGATAALVFAVTLALGGALAQGVTPTKRPSVGGKPLVQAKPSAPTGCKFVGTVKGTKLWAGDCTAAAELRSTTTSDDAPPKPLPAEPTVSLPKEQQ
ncbi:hypothetical protein ABIB68_007267 [Bradyrhizobium sp. F1.2.2]